MKGEDVKEEIKRMLKTMAPTRYTNSDIARTLKLLEPSVRRATKELYEEDMKLRAATCNWQTGQIEYGYEKPYTKP